MSFEYVFDLMTLAGICVFVILPAAAINRRFDQAPKETPEETWQRTSREVEELYAWYVSQLDREGATSIGAAYARYSSRYQESVIDQLRKIFEHAIKLRVFVPREYVFFDLSVTGKKRRRAGFNALEVLLSQKKVQTLLLFATNRLFRKIYRTLEFVDKVHKSWRIRCVFIASGVDTNDKDKWEALLAVNAMVDQFVVTIYANHIRAGHEGAFEKRHVFGTVSYGFMGEIIEGEFTPKGKPRRRLRVNPQTAPVVQKIFHLFVNERLGYNEIARILNDR
jgi:site-specific DNA recombinase